MGLGNILKKAVEIGTDFAGEAIKVGVSLAEEKGIIKSQEVIAAEKAKAERLAAEAERLAIEEERKKREIAEKIKQEKIAEILKPSCENGDCLWQSGRFYFTCEDSIECERKNFTKKKWGNKLVDPILWPYMKRVEYLNNLYKNNRYCDELSTLRDEFYDDFMSEHLFQFKTYKEVENSKANIVMLKFDIIQKLLEGLTLDNRVFALLWYLKDKDVKLTEYMMEILVREISGTGDRMIRLNLTLDFYKNPSLYMRSDEDFEYTVRLFETVFDFEKVDEFFNIDLVDINSLYDSDGNIKPAGIGGPEAGFYGDTIWNTVENWFK